MNKAVASAPPPGSSLQREASQGSRGGGGGGNRRGSQNRGGGSRRGSQNSQGDGGGGGGGGRGGRGGGGRGRGGRNSNRRGSQQGGNSNKNGQKNERINIREVRLVAAGDGNTAKQKAVKRIDAKQFIAARLKYIEPCVEFNPHPACHWTDESRLAQIQALCSKVMELGDVSKNSSKETAPPLEACKPLAVNEETRWKSKAMKQQVPGGAPIEDTVGVDEVVNQARLILNKISWTTLDKLTVRFLDETKLAENDEVRKKCIDMLVHKAQAEPHFGPMYAQLCATIGKQHKVFKKDLLSQCQKEFEVDTAHKIASANEGVEDPELQEYNATLIRKAYIGHMKFLGELYLRDVVKLTIMIHCLDELLKDDEHEESLECFAHLMTTMGEKLDTHAKQNNKPFNWEQVKDLRNSTKISNRIKFLLQDLLDLKDRGALEAIGSNEIIEVPCVIANECCLLFFQVGSRGAKKKRPRELTKFIRKLQRRNKQLLRLPR